LVAGRALLACFLTLVVIGTAPRPVDSAPELTVSVVSPTVNVRPTATVSGSAEGRLFAAMNEFESFQAVVHGGADGLQGVNVVVLDAGTIGAANITLYKAAYYNVILPSDNEGGTGRWADALIPKVDYIYGEPRNAFPFSVPANENAVVWVDVFATPAADAGVRTATLSVSANGVSPVDVPVTLTVLDEQFALPSTSSLANAFLTEYGKPCLAHTGNALCHGNEELRWSLHALYARAALENRVTISNPWPLGVNEGPPPSAHPRRQHFNRYVLPLIQGASPQEPAMRWSEVRLAGARLTALHTHWDCLLASATCLGDWKADAAANGYADRLVFYACDETPSATCPAWSDFNSRAAAADATAPPIDALVTGTINDADAAGSTAFVDVLVPNVQRLDDKINGKPGYAGNQRPNYDAFVAGAGNKLWSYTSCLSHGCGSLASVEAYWDGWPGYAIDAPAIQHRAMGWMSYLYDTRGELYYNTTQSLHQAWNNCAVDNNTCQFFDGANGDGNLFYPGIACSTPGVPACIGGAPGTDIPIETIRLKRIRDGREDYEYLRFADEHGGAGGARALASTLFPNMFSVTPDKDGPQFDLARQELVAMVSGARAGGVAFSSTRDGNKEVYLARDGDAPQQLTQTGAGVSNSHPALSPDGTLVAFTSNRDGNDEIYVVNADGTGTATRLTVTNNATADSKPVWSPDGTHIAFVREAGGNDDVYLMDADGGGVAPLVADAADDFDPAWSPDGARVVFASFRAGGAVNGDSDLYVIGVDGNGLAPLVTTAGDEDGPSWSHDGLRIAFGRFVTDYEVVVRNADGSGAEINVSAAPGTHDYFPAWAPDDGALIFVRGTAAAADLYTVHPDGTGAAPFAEANGPYEENEPDWVLAPPLNNDGDACTDARELGPDPVFGGDRDPYSPWDFFDVTDDRRVDLSDTLAVLARFGASVGGPGYDPTLDRASPDSEKPWRSAAGADGAGIDLTDALVNLSSFGHDCNPPA
jgi:Tol biopolymer transport system component